MLAQGALLVEERNGKRTAWFGVAMAALGFLFCLAIWLSLPLPAKVGGGLWLLAGVIYSAVRTRGFRTQPQKVDFIEV